MACVYIPFDEVVARCTEGVPGEVFSDFSDETEGDISDRHESGSDSGVGEEESLPDPSNTFEDSDVESDTSNGMFCILFVLVI